MWINSYRVDFVWIKVFGWFIDEVKKKPLEAAL